jgi:hypothetical protein
MKALVLTPFFILLAGTTVPGQSPSNRLVRADVSASVGWTNVNKGRLEPYDDWHSVVSGDVAVGWYWTDHLRTDVYAGATDDFTVFTINPATVGGPQPSSSQHRFAFRRAGVSQQYQFGRNQWFHPFVGAGVELLAERSSRIDSAIYSYDPVIRLSRLERPAVEHPERTDVRLHGLVSTGFKAYLDGRVYFLMDGRVTFTDRPEQVTVRMGLGVDF